MSISQVFVRFLEFSLVLVGLNCNCLDFTYVCTKIVQGREVHRRPLGDFKELDLL